MNKLKTNVAFLNQFRRRGGIAIFMSSIGVKLMSSLIAIVVVRMLARDLYGQVSYALVLVSALIPIAGGGFDMTLLRYGALSTDSEKRELLTRYTYVMGSLVSLAMVAILMVVTPLICKNQPASAKYLNVISFLLVGEFIYRTLCAQFRTERDNRKFARLNFARSVIMFLLVLLLVPVFGAYGYAVAIMCTPFLAISFYRKSITRLNGRIRGKLPFPVTELWRYAWFVGLGAMISGFQMRLDTIIVGNFIPDPESLALYRVAGILPMSILLLPYVFFNSEYVHITENHNNRAFVVNYLKQYLMLSLAISAVLILVTQLFGDVLIMLLFGEQYCAAGPIFKILVIGFCGAMMLRQSAGNLLNVSGCAGLTILNVSATLLAQLGIMILVVPKYGLIGAATVMACMLWLSGAACMLTYFMCVFPKLQR